MMAFPLSVNLVNKFPVLLLFRDTALNSPSVEDHLTNPYYCGLRDNPKPPTPYAR